VGPAAIPWPGAGDLGGTVILVEGESDRLAVEALARRRGVDLPRTGVEVVVLGGAQAIGRHLRGRHERGDRRRLTGLCDAGEEALFRRCLERHGLGPITGRHGLEARGFFCCDRDLEDELIRALGAGRVLDIVADQGDLPRFRTLQHQPQWRERPLEAQLRRFMGSGASRKIRYARLLGEALDPERAPRPLGGVLDAALAPAGAAEKLTSTSRPP